MKIPFSIEYKPQIESGEYKVETRDGAPVEIVKWDCRSPHGEAPILAILHGDYDYNRTYSVEGYSTCDSDRLFIVTPEPKLTSWQTFISGCLQKYGLLDCGAADRIAKECSAELLELARKEIMGGWSKGLRDTQDRSGKAYNDGYNLGFNIGYDKGKAEALKDLPRWEKCDPNTIYNTKFGLITNGVRRILMVEGYQIDIDSLEKLPGFKEEEK